MWPHHASSKSHISFWRNPSMLSPLELNIMWPNSTSTWSYSWSCSIKPTWSRSEESTRRHYPNWSDSSTESVVSASVTYVWVLIHLSHRRQALLRYPTVGVRVPYQSVVGLIRPWNNSYSFELLFWLGTTTMYLLIVIGISQRYQPRMSMTQ